MSAYIRDMEMPNSCSECGFRVGWECTAARMFISCDFGEKSADCPLIEVKTPHGGLIDADAIDTSYSDPEVVETLREAPTIIKAEE